MPLFKIIFWNFPKIDFFTGKSQTSKFKFPYKPKRKFTWTIDTLSYPKQTTLKLKKNFPYKFPKRHKINVQFTICSRKINFTRKNIVCTSENKSRKKPPQQTIKRPKKHNFFLKHDPPFIHFSERQCSHFKIHLAIHFKPEEENYDKVNSHLLFRIFVQIQISVESTLKKRKLYCEEKSLECEPHHRKVFCQNNTLDIFAYT